MKEYHPQSPEARRKRLARLRARLRQGGDRAGQARNPAADRRQAGRHRPLRRRLHPRRQPRLSVAAGAVPLLHPGRGRRPAVRAGPRTRRWRSRRSSAGFRRMSPACWQARSTKCCRARIGRAALVRRDRRPVDRGQLHRDDPRHSAPRLWRQIFGQLLAIPAGGDGAHPGFGGPAVGGLCRHRRAGIGASFRDRQSCPFRQGLATRSASIASPRR